MQQLFDLKSFESQVAKLKHEIKTLVFMEVEVRFRNVDLWPSKSKRTNAAAQQVERTAAQQVERTAVQQVERTDINNIPSSIFTRLQEYLDRPVNSYVRTPEVIVDDIDEKQEIRRRKQGTKTTYIKKDQQDKIEVPNYGFIIALSLEKEPSRGKLNKFAATYQRRKNLVSYNIPGSPAKIELSRVTVGKYVNSDEVKLSAYETLEVELEYDFTQPNASVDRFHTEIVSIYKIMYDTNTIYTLTERKKVKDYLVQTLNKINEKYNAFLATQTRNLIIKDLVYGGIIGNQYTSYTVTLKADGLRKFLVINSTGVWFIFPDKEFNLIARLPVRSRDTNIEAILDGEWIPRSRRPAGADPSYYLYYTFDCPVGLSSNNLNKPHSQRLLSGDKVAEYLNELKIPQLTVRTKTFMSLHSITDPVEHFFRVMKGMILAQSSPDYIVEGFIFTPELITDKGRPLVGKQYNPQNEFRFPLNKRVLTNVPDTCKLRWHIVFDFMPIKQGSNTILYALNQKAEQKGDELLDRMIRFTGTPEYPYDINTPVDMTGFADLPRGMIVEFEWVFAETNHFKAKLLRDDKPNPNRIDIATANWLAVKRPVTPDTITGENTALMRAYHGRIKTHLYQQVTGKNIVSLEIGSGNIGDFNRWRAFSTVYCVEPNPVNLDNSRQRLTSFGFIQETKDHWTSSTNKQEIVLIQATGQDTANIMTYVKQQVDVVSLMLSMSFFWDKPTSFASKLVCDAETLTGLAATINQSLKPGGKILYFTIDGESVVQLMRPFLNPTVRFDHVKLGRNIDLRLNSGSNVVNVNISDSKLVDNITEYLVYPEDLWRLLDGVHSHERSDVDKEQSPQANTAVSRADGQLLLDYGSRQYSNLFIFGTLSKKKKSTSKEMTAKTTSVKKTTHPVTRPGSYPKNILCSWYDGVVRSLSTIADGDCSAHSVLQAIDSNYSEHGETSTQIKSQLAKKLRREIAWKLGQPSSSHPELINYFVVFRGQFAILGMTDANNVMDRKALKQKLRDAEAPPDSKEMAIIKAEIGEDQKSVIPISVSNFNASLQGLQDHIRSTDFLLAEIYGGIADMIDINIHIFLPGDASTGISLISSYENLLVESKYHICIKGDGGHYETLAFPTDEDKLQTVLTKDHPFIKALRRKYPQEIEYKRFNPLPYLIDQVAEIHTKIETDNRSRLTLRLVLPTADCFYSTTDPLYQFYQTMIPTGVNHRALELAIRAREVKLRENFSRREQLDALKAQYDFVTGERAKLIGDWSRLSEISVELIDLGVVSQSGNLSIANRQRIAELKVELKSIEDYTLNIIPLPIPSGDSPSRSSGETIAGLQENVSVLKKNALELIKQLQGQVAKLR